ncbi:MAG: carboxymuconolactone decarboxylase family protein [Bacteroidetes bacterium]|nr:carboxymuconolactone decarboxylase family protein [Fibrella sp.]
MNATQTISSQADVLALAQARYGRVPGLIGLLSEHPLVAQLFIEYGTALKQAGVLVTTEKDLVMFTVSHVNGCPYCKRSHKAALLQYGLSEADIIAIETGDSLTNTRYNDLVYATRLLVKKRAKLSPAEYQDLIQRGIDRVQQLEIIAFIALKTITNYTNSLNEVSKVAAGT